MPTVVATIARYILGGAGLLIGQGATHMVVGPTPHGQCVPHDDMLVGSAQVPRAPSLSSQQGTPDAQHTDGGRALAIEVCRVVLSAVPPSTLDGAPPHIDDTLMA